MTLIKAEFKDTRQRMAVMTNLLSTQFGIIKARVKKLTTLFRMI
jgi:hypothetical protein